MTRIRGFEPVKDISEDEYFIPEKGSKNSACYDFRSPRDAIIYPGEDIKLNTNIKAYMLHDEVLMIYIRSSMGIRSAISLKNNTAIIDSDFFSNQNNDGNICLCLKNNGENVYLIQKGDKIGQGMFIKYLESDNGNTDEQRVGGIGSTGN